MAEESEVKKQVDEAWKKQIEKEKEELKSADKDDSKQEQQIQPSFYDITSMYVMQALFFLGMIKDQNNPDQGTKVDLASARLNIQMLTILQEKTKGNLNDEEKKYIDNALTEIRMIYVQRAGEGNDGGSSGNDKQDGPSIITP